MAGKAGLSNGPAPAEHQSWLSAPSPGEVGFALIGTDKVTLGSPSFPALGAVSRKKGSCAGDLVPAIWILLSISLSPALFCSRLRLGPRAALLPCSSSLLVFKWESSLVASHSSITALPILPADRGGRFSAPEAGSPLIDALTLFPSA